MSIDGIRHYHVHESIMVVRPLQQLDRYGPEHCEQMVVDDARIWCRSLAGGFRENFTVISMLVPSHLRDDFAAVYAFCRWADDLSDEAGSPEKAQSLLKWWRGELEQCYAGNPHHPVFSALRPTIERFALPRKWFDQLIDAFEQDQVVSRYDSWEQLQHYCAGSANPVGRLVLALTESPQTEEALAASDALCTALQLTNHWQDAKRDLLERDRIYIPRDMNDIENFESRFRTSAEQGFGVDQAFLREARVVIRSCIERTWPLFEKGGTLLNLLSPEVRPIVWLFAAGGVHVLRQVELWNYETMLHRPTLSPTSRIMLVIRAWMGSKVIPRALRWSP